MIQSSETIIEYWLGDAQTDAQAAADRSKLWYGYSPDTDQYLEKHFKETLLQAESGQLDDWSKEPAGSLALVILLDQFSRNIYRGSKAAFKNDDKAIGIARGLIDRNADRELSYIGRAFLYHPFEHSETMTDQDWSVLLFSGLYEDANDVWSEQLQGFMKYAINHREIIKTFGRFPHRNIIFGRQNTPEETAFLNQDNRSYGQSGKNESA